MTHKNKVLTIFVLAIFIPIGANLVTMLYINSLAKRGIWFEEKLSKTAFMRQSTKSYDCVIVGSSHAQNHINTNLLEQLGFSAFNLGLAGRPFSDQVYSVMEASKVAKKYVILYVYGGQFTAPLNFPDYPTIKEISYFMELNTKYITKIRLSTIISTMPCVRISNFTKQYYRNLGRENYYKKLLKEKYNYDSASDLRAVSYIRGHRDRIVVVYKNGDGQVFSNNSDCKARNVNIFPKNYNSQTLAYIEMLGNYVRKYGLTLIVNIGPTSCSTKFNIDLDRLHEKVPNVLFIDTQEITHDKPDLWTDPGHLNIRGTRLYTLFLSEVLADIHSNHI